MTITSISVAKPGTPPGAPTEWVDVTPAFVTATITPDTSRFERAFRDFGAAIKDTNKAMKRLRVQVRSATRSYLRATRRPSLIHNGRKPR